MSQHAKMNRRELHRETMRYIRGRMGATLPDVRPSGAPRVTSKLAGLVAMVDAHDQEERRIHRLHRADEGQYGSRPGQRASSVGGREVWQRGRNDGGYKAVSRKLRNMRAQFRPWE